MSRATWLDRMKYVYQDTTTRTSILMSALCTNKSIYYLKTISEIDIYSFNLSIILQSILSQLTSKPAILISTKWHLEKIISRRIDPNTSGFQFPCNTVTAFDIFRKD